MERAHNAASRALARSSACDEQQAPRSDRVADAWSLLVQMYGHRIIDDYGEAPPPAWADAFSRLTDDELANGFRNLEADGSRFPPTQPEFVEACRRKPPVRYLGVPLTPEQKRLMLEVKKAAPEVVSRHLANMRAKLGMRS